MVSSRNEDGWSIPGGGLEPNEQADNTAVREALEEVCQPVVVVAFKSYIMVVRIYYGPWDMRMHCAPFGMVIVVV